MKRHFFSLLFLVSVILFQQRDLFSPGFFPMHDDTQVARVVTMGRAMRNGQFPVRWVDDLGYGYGYPIFNFYGPLPYYVGGFFYATGFSGLTATKLMILTGGILAAGAMYYLVAHHWRRTAGLVAAVFYSFAVYHAVQIFVRGAIGEYWVTIFLPVILLGVWEVLFYNPRRGILMGSVGMAGAVLSHTLLGYACVLFVGAGIAAYAVYCFARKACFKQLRSLTLLFLFGLSFSAFFWLPAVMEMRYTDVAGQVSATANYSDNYVCPLQLWNSIWGFGGSTAGCNDGLSFALGKILIFGAVAGLFSYLLLSGKIRKMIIFSAIITAISIFFMLQISSFMWNLLPFFSYLQYPWRFLAFSIFGLSLLTGLSLVVIQKRYLRLSVGILLILICIMLNQKWFRPQYVYPRVESDFESEEDIRWRVSKISDEYLPKELPRPGNPNQIVRDTIVRRDTYNVKNVIDRETFKKYEINTKANEEIQVNLAAFPGWQYVVNGKPAQFRIADGIPFLKVPLGFSTMELAYKGTLVQFIGNVISAITCIGFIYIYGKKNIA